MQQIPPAELPDFKKYFTDLFHEFQKQDLKKYFAPYYDDKYTSVSINKIGPHLWSQYKGTAYLIDDHIEEFTDRIFD